MEKEGWFWLPHPQFRALYIRVNSFRVYQVFIPIKCMEKQRICYGNAKALILCYFRYVEHAC